MRLGTDRLDPVDHCEVQVASTAQHIGQDVNHHFVVLKRESPTSPKISERYSQVLDDLFFLVDFLAEFLLGKRLCFGADEIFLKREIWPLFRRDGFYSETIIPLWVLIIIILLVIYVAVKLIT